MNIIATRANYYDELRAQMTANEEQLDKLEDLLFVERLRAIFYFSISFLILALLATIVVALLDGRHIGPLSEYSTLVNIAAVFLFFGLIETFSFFIAAFSLVRDIRRLIRRQISALRDAKAEFSAA